MLTFRVLLFVETISTWPVFLLLKILILAQLSNIYPGGHSTLKDQELFKEQISDSSTRLHFVTVFL
jgi:hypothetical protein